LTAKDIGIASAPAPQFYSVNAPLENKLTLLMWATPYGQESSVNLLLNQGADRQRKDNRGKTAADMAREGGHDKVLALLTQVPTGLPKE
jgi:ankyrin repeat protein